MHGIEIDVSHIALAALGFVIWLVRLEGRVNAASDKAEMAAVAIKSLQHSHSILEIKVLEELGKVRESLARIEERSQRKEHWHGSEEL